MTNLILFINSFLSYLMVVAVFVATIAVAIFAGIKLSKKKNLEVSKEEQGLQKKYDVIFWDMDGTLLDFKVAQKEALAQVFRTIHRPLTNGTIELYRRINELYWKKLELGEITQPDYEIDHLQDVLRICDFVL